MSNMINPHTLLYLDPGTGSLLFSVIMGMAATAFFVLRGAFHRVRATLAGGGRKGASHELPELTIYSEGAQYAGIFRPILQELGRRGIPCIYLSSDPADPLLKLDSSLVRGKCIGKGYAAWGQLNTLQSEVCLMTTPGLDVMQLKRSRRVRHYAHVIHAPTDKAFNRPYSFDYFDSVFICGPHQERTIRCLEGIRKTPVKELFTAGCVYYDEMAARYQQAIEKDALPRKADSSAASRRQRVLLAPTWGRNGLLSRYGMSAIEPLAKAGFEVVVRPHPQSRIVEGELLRALEVQTRGYENVLWDSDPSPLEAMVRADLLLSDISGIVFDFAFLTGKPVLTLELAVEKRGFEAADLPYEPWELEVLEVVGRKIGAADLARLPQIIQEEAGNETRKAAIAELRTEYVHHFGNAAPHLVDHLQTLLARTASQGAAGRGARRDVAFAGQVTAK